MPGSGRAFLIAGRVLSSEEVEVEQTYYYNDVEWASFRLVVVVEDSNSPIKR